MKYELCGYELDLERGELRRQGGRVALRAQVASLLVLLVQNRHRLVTIEEIERAIWPRMQISPGSVANLVFEAREILGDDGRSQHAIRTVRGQGYRLIARVVGSEREPTSGAAASPFVGRESALDRLRAALRESLQGRTRIVLTAGEPGIGKTRLIEEFVGQHSAPGATVIVSRCVETEVAPAFWPWIQILRSCLTSLEPSLPLPIDEKVAAEVARLTSEAAEVASATDERDAAVARFARFDAVSRTLAARANAGPLVLVIEDLHRADAASLQLLGFVAEMLVDSRLLIVATYRDTETGRCPEFSGLAARLLRMPCTSAIALHGLERADVAALVAGLLGQAPTSSMLEQLYDLTGGNPFFVQLVAELLSARCLLHSERGGLALDLHRDAGVREAILQHLVGLSPECRQLLALASVVGREAPISTLDSLADADGRGSVELIREALDARVIERNDGIIRFSHVLIRDALYDGLDLATRVEIHGRLARLLERAHGTSSDLHTLEIAHHYLAAAPAGFSEEAIRFQSLAASVAANRLAYEDAVQYRQKALQALERHAPHDDARRTELLIELGEARMRADDRPGGCQAFKHAVDLARRCRDGERLARAALGYSPGLLALEVDVVDPYLLETLELAVAWTEGLETQLRARLLGRLAMGLAWTAQAERRSELADAAIAMAERLGDPGTRAFVLCARVAALWGPDDAELRASLAARAIELAREARDREQELVAMLHRITSLLQLGRFPAARSAMETFALRARALRQPHATWWISLFLAHQAMLRGDFDATLAWTQALAEEGARAHDHNAALCGPTVTSFCNGERGDGQRALQVISHEVVFDSSSPAAARRATLAVYAAWAGESATATEVLEAFAQHGYQRIPRDMMWIHTLGHLAEVAATLGAEKSAREIYALLAPLEGQFVVSGLAVMVWRPISYLLGRLAAAFGERDLACAHFQRATLECRSAEMWPSLAHTHRHHADALARRGGAGDLALAASLSSEARAIAERLGMRHTWLQGDASSA